ncbi:MAG: hypothetical protein LUH21_07960 [Clostridiales bacterium]|nr:hypothetical protein [Clostridiales bacterium]
MKCEKELANVLLKNAIMFIDSAIGYINSGIVRYNNMVQSVVNLQIAMELALKSSVVSNYGIKVVLVQKQSEMNDNEIDNLFYANKLKIREYDDIKNFTKGKSNLYIFDRDDYNYMEIFQTYRNSILHSSYVFNADEKKSIEKNIIHTLIHILGVLMSGETADEDRIFMQEYLNEHEYAKLLKNPIYEKELEAFLHNEYSSLYLCPSCGTRTMTIDYKCARCFMTFRDSFLYEYVTCNSCGENTVICDSANIEANGNIINGLCLNCGHKTKVYKCFKCGSFSNLESMEKNNCKPGFCWLFD